MARLVVYQGFVEGRSQISSDRIGENIDAMLRTIELMPGVGSSLVPESISLTFGPSVRKALVSPFEIIYEYNEEADVAYVYDLLYAPEIR